MLNRHSAAADEGLKNLEEVSQSAVLTSRSSMNSFMVVTLLKVLSTWNIQGSRIPWTWDTVGSSSSGSACLMLTRWKGLSIDGRCRLARCASACCLQDGVTGADCGGHEPSSTGACAGMQRGGLLRAGSDSMPLPQPVRQAHLLRRPQAVRSDTRVCLLDEHKLLLALQSGSSASCLRRRPAASPGSPSTAVNLAFEREGMALWKHIGHEDSAA